MRGTKRFRAGAWRLQAWDAPAGRYRNATVKAPDTAAGAKKADAALRRLVDEIEAGRPTDGMTVADLLATWQRHRADRWAPKTRDSHRQFAQLIGAEIGGIPLERLRPADIDACYVELGRTRSSSSVRRIHRALHAALNLAVRWDLIATNPAGRVDPPEEAPRAESVPSPEMLRLVLAAIDERPDLSAYFRLAANSGGRRGSLSAVQWGDVDLDAGSLVLARRLQLSSEGVTEAPGTKSRTAHVVALGPSTVAALRRWQMRQAEDALKLGVRGGLVWVFGRAADPRVPRRPDYWTREWRRTTRKVERAEGLPEGSLDRVRLHDLRVFMATNLLGAGVDPVTAAGRGGWRGTGTMYERYAHRLPARDREAADLLDRLIDGVPEAPDPEADAG